jgi:Fe-S cluster biogenesis protein NfuA
MNPNDPNLIARIESALDSIRPYLQADEGNVSFVEVTDDMIVRLELIRILQLLLHEQHDA